MIVPQSFALYFPIPIMIKIRGSSRIGCSAVATDATPPIKPGKRYSLAAQNAGNSHPVIPLGCGISNLINYLMRTENP